MPELNRNQITLAAELRKIHLRPGIIFQEIGIKNKSRYVFEAVLEAWMASPRPNFDQVLILEDKGGASLEKMGVEK